MEIFRRGEGSTIGLLDRSGNIVVDAVLTDLGRQKIARNDGSFKIVAYGFGDDEIDYGLFNPTTGSAYVDQQILASPVFEANVNEKLGLNHPLITITNPNLKYLPKLSADNTSVSIGEERGLSAGITLRFYQDTSQNAKIVPVEIQDSAFKIELLNDFLHVENETALDISPYGTAIYLVSRDSALVQSTQGSQVTFKVRVQSLGSTTWSTYGSGASPNRTIATQVKVTGINSGLSSTATVTISEEFTR